MVLVLVVALAVFICAVGMFLSWAGQPEGGRLHQAARHRAMGVWACVMIVAALACGGAIEHVLP